MSALASPVSAGASTFVAACSGTTGDVPSLVSAINTANSTAGADVVALGSGCTYTLTAVDNYWYGPNGLPAIASDITVAGNGATIARSGTTAFRLFFVGADPTATDTQEYASPGPGVLRLRDVTLSGGLARGGSSIEGGGGAGMGGAIFSQGTVILEGSTLTANEARGGSANESEGQSGGGGIGTPSTRSGGGFGPGTFGGAAGGEGGPGGGGGGGGGGFALSDKGLPAGAGKSGPGPGGGFATGLGGTGAGLEGTTQPGGDGSGSGGCGVGAPSTEPGGNGGAFGAGGIFVSQGGLEPGGGGGGVGGGGSTGECGGGGGFGGGGGNGFFGGDGGFGGGGGGGGKENEGGKGGAPGFGGGTAIAGAGSGAGMGGAIFSMQGTLVIANSTLADNQALGGEDKIEANRGKGIAGAVFNLSGSFTAVGSTFAGNAAPDGASQIFNLVYDAHTERTAQATLRDTIVADGVGPFDLASNRSAQIKPSPNLGSATADVSQFDLVRTSQAQEGGTITGLPLTSDPLLGPLQDNGGPTHTMGLPPGSPAIDAGSAFGLPTDQRGDPRPVDFAGIPNGLAGDGSDIGAFEVQQSCPGQALPLEACKPVVSTNSNGAGNAGGTSTLASITGLRESNSIFVVARASTPLTGSTARRHRKGTVFSFELDRPATVTLAIERPVRGRRVGTRCKAATHKLRHRRPCTRLVTVKTLRRTGHLGSNSIIFTGRIAAKALAPGRYRAAFTAIDSAGTSPRQTLSFTIVRR